LIIYGFASIELNSPGYFYWMSIKKFFNIQYEKILWDFVLLFYKNSGLKNQDIEIIGYDK
jgi:hypothetical protein